MSYTPKDDSSPGHKNEATDKTGPILVLTSKTGERLCRCGCGTPVAAKRSFRQGHDAKLKGILGRALLNGVPVTVVVLDGETFSHTPAAVAAEFLPGYVLGVAKPRSTKARKGPKLGDSRRVKVGRWEYNGKITAVADDGSVTVEYADAKGTVKTATV